MQIKILRILSLLFFPLLLIFCNLAPSGETPTVAVQSTTTEIIVPSDSIPELTQEPTEQIPTDTPPYPILGDTQLRPSDRMVQVFVPGGEFNMGSTDEQVDFDQAYCNEFVQDCRREWFTDQQPAHSVELTAFWIDRTEVTNAQYALCVQAGICQEPRFKNSYTHESYYGNSIYDNYPVIYVDWSDASAYCQWAGGRMPTEAEWEYAARGPQGNWFPWGNRFEALKLNYCDSDCPLSWKDPGSSDGYLDLAPVGSFPSGASWVGALDLAGNVWEWVADWYGPYSADSQINPTGPVGGEARVVRGGSWDHEPCDAMSTARSWYYPNGTSGEWEITPGFRCVTDLTNP